MSMDGGVSAALVRSLAKVAADLGAGLLAGNGVHCPRQEDESGRPLWAMRVGSSTISWPVQGSAGGEVFITGAVKCRPPGNRDPRAGEIAACRRYLGRQFDAVSPKVVCAMGLPPSALLLAGHRLPRCHSPVPMASRSASTVFGSFPLITGQRPFTVRN